LRRAIIALSLSIFLVLGFAQAFSQPSGEPIVTLAHNYTITNYGLGLLNDTFTFKNNGTSTVQIPSFQLGFPNSIASRSAGFVVTPSAQYSLSQTPGKNVTLLSVTPNQASLAGGSTAVVSVEGYLHDTFNVSVGGFTGVTKVLLPTSPSVSIPLTKMVSTLAVPQAGSFSPVPTGYAAGAQNASLPSFQRTDTNITPQASVQVVNFTEPNPPNFTPLRIPSFVRTIVPSISGQPMVQDKITLDNLASYSVPSIQFTFLSPTVNVVLMLPNTLPPLMNPTPISVAGGLLTFANTPYGRALLADSNVTFTLSYPIPASDIKVSGTTVNIKVPYSLPVPTLIENYTVGLSPTKGIIAKGPASSTMTNVNPLTTGSLSLSYSVSLGWASDSLVPAGALIFGVAFILLAVQKPKAEETEEEKAGWKTSDLVKSFEEELGLERETLDGLASKTKGSVGKTDFDRMKSEIDDLRARALGRLNEVKQSSAGSRLFDQLVEVGEADVEEARAVKDLLNLYSQYHSNRMNAETFQRLLPNYKKRVDAAMNHLSDALNIAQKEGK